MQENYSQDIERRIEEYRAHQSILENIRTNAFSVDYLRGGTTNIPGYDTRTIKFVVEVKNTAAEKSFNSMS